MGPFSNAAKKLSKNFLALQNKLEKVSKNSPWEILNHFFKTAGIQIGPPPEPPAPPRSSPRRFLMTKRLKNIQLELHADFIKVVETSRGSKLKDPEKNNIFTGEFWTGSAALKLGLIDVNDSNFVNAKKRFKQLIKIDDKRYKPISKLLEEELVLLENKKKSIVSMKSLISSKKYIDDVYNYGCYVMITDWNQLEDGLLGITVQGKYLSLIHI